MEAHMAETVENIEILKQHFGSYRRSAEFLGVSKDRYYQWKANPESIPPQGRRLIELAVESIRRAKDASKIRAR